MGEYIERNAIYEKISELEELVRNRVADTPPTSPAYARYVSQLNERTSLKHIIFDTLAADVAPVVHGRWKERPPIRKIKNTNIPVVECSECGLTFCDIINNHTEIYRYCPYCGAKMDQE